MASGSHEQAKDFVSFTHQQVCGNRTIHAPAHCEDDALSHASPFDFSVRFIHLENSRGVQVRASRTAKPALPGVAKSPSGKTSSSELIQGDTVMADKIQKSEEQWQEELSPEAFRILRQKGTERAFTGELNENKAFGVYQCAGCGLELFESEAKFDSGSGWPSFFEPASEDRIDEHTDRSYGMVRTEVACSRCGGHLGHVFPDGPNPTGLRYCINSASLEFKKDEKGSS